MATSIVRLRNVLNDGIPLLDICDVLCDFGSCGGKTSSAENVILIDVKF